MTDDAGPSDAPTLTWLASPGCSYEESLIVGRDVTAAAFGVLPTLPRKDASRHYPATISEAISLVHARDDAKKKLSTAKAAKSKHKSLTAPHFTPSGTCPGAMQGGGDAGAFWMYVEDYFRDATQEDLHDILAFLAPPDQDPAFAFIPPGSGTAIPTMRGMQTMASVSPLPPSQPPEENSRELMAAAPALAVVPGGLGGAYERRSSRLVSRSSRGAADGARYFGIDDALDDDVDLEMIAARSEPQTARAPAAAPAMTTARRGQEINEMPNAKTIVTTPQGTIATTLWELISKEQLKNLATQVSELIDALGVKDASESLKLLPLAPSSEQNTATLTQWLGATAASLNRVLKCSMDVPLLGTRRKSGGLSEETGLGGPSCGQPSCACLPSGAYIHPYTRLVLRSEVPAHVQESAVEPFVFDPMAAGGQLTGKTPTTEGLGIAMPTEDGEATGRSAANPEASHVGLARDGVTLIAPAEANDTSGRNGGQQRGDQDGQGRSPRADGSSRPSSRQRAISNYALIAGKQDPVKTAALTAQRKANRAAVIAAETQVAAAHPVALAAARAVAATSGSMASGAATAEQYAQATADMAIIAAVPQDEVAAETLALQAELAAVAAANRVRLVAALRGLLGDLDQQQKGAAMRADEAAEVMAWVRGVQEARQREIKLRREASHRDALLAAGAQKGATPASRTSPRPTLGRHGLGPGQEGGLMEAPFLGPEELYDVLAQRGEDDEAFCAVCGEGHSVEPNVILFCDRCDVAVHQRCYDVAEVPPDEWLCWPCQEYEAAQRAAGVPQPQIRPPHALPDERRRLSGGSREVKCVLCPIKCGAFRKTSDGQWWVHQACALWTPDTYLLAGSGPDVVEGIAKIPARWWTMPCDICGLTDGVVVNCKHPGTCQYAFHVLCARNCGLYLTVRPDILGRSLYRIYCAVHSQGQKERDERALAALMEGQQRAAAAAQDKAARVALRQAALEALAIQEEEYAQLQGIRVNMELVRVLLDQCKRRERLKRQAAMTAAALHAERFQDPAAALSFLEKIKVLEAQGMTPGQQADLLCSAASTPTAGGVGGEDAMVEDEPQPQHLPDNNEVIKTEPTVQAATPPILPAVAAEDPSGLGSRRSARTTAKRQRDDRDEITHSLVDAVTQSIRMTAPAAEAVPPKRSSRRGQPEPVVASVETDPSKSGGDAIANPVPIERRRLFSSAEAEAANRQLPPGLRYVPVDELPKGVNMKKSSASKREVDERQAKSGTPSARASRAAAREAASAPEKQKGAAKSADRRVLRGSGRNP